jgi:hypothetical protein
LRGLVLVDHADGEARVHEHVVADLGFGTKARHASLPTPPKLTVPMRVVSLPLMLEDLSRNRKTHDQSFRDSPL